MNLKSVIRQTLNEGDVVPFKKRSESLAGKTPKFTQLNSIKDVEHPALVPILQKHVEGSTGYYIHRIDVDNKPHGYMVQAYHKDAGGNEYDLNHAYDIHGNNLNTERVPLTDI